MSNDISSLSLQKIEEKLDGAGISGRNGLAIAQVKLDGYPLFAVTVPTVAESKAKTDALSQRSQGIENNLNRIKDQGINPETLQVQSTLDSKSGLPIISINSQYVMTVTTLDAQLQGAVPEQVAKEYATLLKDALLRSRQERQPSFVVRQGLLAAGAILIVMVVSRILGRFQQTLEQKALDQQALEKQALPLPTGAVTEIETPEPAEIASLHLRQKQRKAMQDARRRALHLSQFGLWGICCFSILGFFPQTRWLQPIVLSAPLKVVGIGFCIYLLSRLSDSLIDHFFEVFDDGQPLSLQASERLDQRLSTVSGVVKSVVSILLVGAGVLASMSVLGVDLVPLLAGAGIVGIGLSLASQNVIKDVINGFLILLEDQYAVGDVIAVGDVSGLVESMNLRITQLRNNEGRLITIPNSVISIVQNLSKDWSRVDLTIQVSLETNPDQMLKLLHELSQQFYRDPLWHSKLLGEPEVLGIDDINHAGMLLRVWIKTRPLEQWVVAREFRRRLKLVLTNAQVEIGMPRQAVWSQNFPATVIEPQAPK